MTALANKRSHYTSQRREEERAGERERERQARHARVFNNLQLHNPDFSLHGKSTPISHNAPSDTTSYILFKALSMNSISSEHRQTGISHSLANVPDDVVTYHKARSQFCAFYPSFSRSYTASDAIYRSRPFRKTHLRLASARCEKAKKICIR